jgi:hypothetical protein
MSNSEKLTEHFGRKGIKVFEIVEENVIELTTFSEKPLSNYKLFYPSTGSGNSKFSNKFSNTLVPFYGMEGDKDETLIKAIMLRREVYDKRTLFKWQVDLLNNVKDHVEAELLDDFHLLLDNYFNTPGEMLVSIEHNEGFWKDNETLRENILNLLKSYDITYTDITENIENITEKHILSSLLLFGKDEEQGFYHSEDDKLIGNLNKKELRKNWLDTVKIIEKKRKDEAIEKKLSNKKNKNKKNKNKKNKKGGKSKKYKRVKKVKNLKKTKKKRVL